jgi:hypothetical protein
VIGVTDLAHRKDGLVADIGRTRESGVTQVPPFCKLEMSMNDETLVEEFGTVSEETRGSPWGHLYDGGFSRRLP